MEKFRLYANSVPITFNSWIASFVGIVLIRIFFEQFSSFIPGRFLVIEMPSILHYTTFFLTATVALMVILMFFAKTNLKEVAVITLFGSFALWIAPLIDLATSGVGGHIISYLFVSGKELFLQYITYFFHGSGNIGVTLGMRVEGIFLAIFCYTYVYSITKNIFRSVVAVVLCYSFVFFLGSIPSLIALFLSQQSGVLNSIIQSMISSQIIANNVHPSFSATNIGLLDLAFNKIMLGTNIIILMPITISLFFLSARKKLIAIVKNSRPERMFYFFLLFTFGITLAHSAWFTNWIDVQSYILAIVAFTCAGMFSICQNDIYDEEIDTISNPNRPLISKDLSKDDLEIASKILLILAFISAYASSHYVLFFTSLFTFVYYIYSNPPLRLKRFIILNSFLIGLAGLVVIMAGFFLTSLDKTITAFPSNLILAIVISLSMISNFKDIKDLEGDKANGITTIPVLLGAKKSKMLIALMSCFFILFAPWYFKISFLFIPSILASLLSWYFITEENYKEWKSFVVYMVYLILIIGALAFK